MLPVGSLKFELFIVSTNHKRNCGGFHSVTAAQGLTCQDNMTVHDGRPVAFMSPTWEEGSPVLHRKLYVYIGTGH